MNKQTRINMQFGVTDEEAVSRLALILLGLAVVALIVARLSDFVLSASDGGTSVLAFVIELLERSRILELFYMIRGPFVVVSALVCLALVVGIRHANSEKAKIREQFTHEMKLVEQKLSGDALSNKNTRWEHVLTMANSESPGDWRVAILEADTMLDELTTSMSYRGDTLGDKLKSVEKSDFNTLDLAWEAHKVRNRIAHSGTNFILTSRETKRVVDLYRQVFEEFDYI